MKRTILLVALISGLIFVSSTKTKSYVRGTVGSPTGTPLSWHLTNPSQGVGVSGGKIQYEINQAGSKDIASFASLEAAINSSFQAWQNIPTTTVGFTELAPSSLAFARNDGHFLVIWADATTTISDGSGGFVDVSGALAKTFTSFSPSTGEIVDADMVFNGHDNPWNTTGDPSGFDVAEVATHEAGHSIGLDHSAVFSATMFPQTGKGVTKSRTLSPDDQAAASIIYPSATFSTTKGKIGGTVTGGGNIFGAHVVAMDSNGNVAAATLSDQNGNYLIEGLSAGAYTVYAEPLDPPGGIFSKDNLGSFYSTINTNFLTSSDQVVNVTAGSTTSNNITVTAGTPAINTTAIIQAANINAGTFSFTNSGTTVHQGDTSMVVGVQGTGFITPAITFTGTGITVTGNVNFGNTNIKAVKVDIAANATAGARDIIITDGGQRTIATGALEILSSSQSADLQMTFTATAGPVQIGQEITYTGSVTNNGPNDASQLTLDIPVPPGAILSGGGGPPAGLICDNNQNGFTGTLHCSAATFPNGFTSNFQIIFTPVSPVASLAATATVASATTDPNTNNNAVTATTAVSTSSAPPTTTGLDPINAPQNGPGNFNLTVQGTGFTRASKILFNGQQRATTNFSDDKNINTPITAVDLQTAANITVTVNTPAPGGGTSNAQTFSVVSNLQSQTITFPAITTKTFGGPTFSLGATASSGLPVTYSVTAGQNLVSLNGSTVTILGAGSVTIKADQAGNANFLSAPSASQSFTINKASQTITFNPIAAHTFGDAPFGLTATASSTLTVSFSIVGGTGSGSLNGSTLTIAGAGTIIIQADQTGNANISAAPAVQQTLTVNKANQTITFGALANKTMGDPPFNLSATSTSGLAVTFTATVGGSLVNINGNTVTLVAFGSVTIQANQVGSANFNAAPSVPQSFTIAKGTALLILNTPTQIADGTPKGATVTTTPPGLGGVTITYNGSVTPPTAAGTYAVSASLNNPNFTGNVATGSLRIVSFSPSSQSVNPATSGSANTPPASSPGISATLNHAAGGVAAGLTVGVYSGNPSNRGILETGGGYGDVKVTNSNSGDTATINYYYPASITGTNETQLQFFYFTGSGWALVKDGSGNLPTRNTTDNLDGTTSGGRFTITVNNTNSSPRVSQLTGTFFTAALAIMGDCDLNGVINVSDLLFMANSLAGNVILTPTQKGACDVFNDNKGLITVQDLLVLANFLAGNTLTLPVNTGGPISNPGDTVPEAFLTPPLDQLNLGSSEQWYRARLNEIELMAFFDRRKPVFAPL